MNDLPPLLSLKAFEAVARHKNIVKAADELCVTRSAVSQQVKQLEDYLGLTLIDRSNNKINLTTAAKVYAEELTQLFQNLRFLTRQLRKTHHNNCVTLNLPTTYAMNWLIPKMQEFQDQHPAIDLRISTPMRAINFAIEDIDLAIDYGNGDKAWPDLRVEYLFAEEWIPVCTQNYLSRASKNEYRYIEISSLERKDAWNQWCKKYKEPLPLETQILHIPHALETIQAALNGLGIACVPKRFVENHLQNKHLILPFGDRSVPSTFAFYLLSPSITQERAEVKIVREWLLALATLQGKIK